MKNCLQKSHEAGSPATGFPGAGKQFGALLKMFMWVWSFLFLGTFALTAEEVPVYVIIGQSNAAGWSRDAGSARAVVEAAYTGGSAAQKAFIYNPSSTLPGKWAQHWFVNTSNDKTGLIGGGRDVGAPLVMFHRQAFPDSPVYIVKHAVGGTSIADVPNTHWDIMSGDNNTASLWYGFKNTKFLPALRQLVADGKTPVVKGIFWMQGETNANGTGAWGGPGTNSEDQIMTVAQYQQHLQKLIDRLKTEFVVNGVNYVTPQTKIMIGTISTLNSSGGTTGTPLYSWNVRFAQQNIAAADPQVFIVNNEGSTINGTGNDGIHFNDDDFYVMAQKILKVAEPSSTVPGERFVKAGASGTGASWDDASGSISDMLNVSGVTMVRAAAGTYTENVTIPQGKSVLGGYAPGSFEREKAQDAYPWEFMNPTVLNGTLNVAGTADGLTVSAPAVSTCTLSGTLANCQTSNIQVLLTANNSYILGTKIKGVDRAGGENDNTGWGGCVYKANTSGFITTIQNSWLTGGSAKIGGAVFYGTTGTLNMVNTIVSNCRTRRLGLSGDAGSVVAWGSTLNMTNCTVVRNSCDDNSAGGGGVSGGDPGVSVNLKNSILWGNASKSPLAVSGGSWTAANCAFESQTLTGTGNINLAGDPGFVTPSATIGVGGVNEPQNWLLNAKTSPAVNVATIAAADAPSADIAGSKRPMGSGYDMGAFEFKERTAVMTSPDVVASLSDLAFNPVPDVLEYSLDGVNFQSAPPENPGFYKVRVTLNPSGEWPADQKVFDFYWVSGTVYMGKDVPAVYGPSTTYPSSLLTKMLNSGAVKNIRLASGTYAPAVNGTNGAFEFTRSNFILSGGWDLNDEIQKPGLVTTLTPVSGSNNRVVYIGANVTLDRLTLSGGNTSNSGAGVYVNSACTVQNCVIRNNLSAGTVLTTYGGGVYLNAGGANFINTQIINNTSTYHGAGVGSPSTSSSFTTPTVFRNCLIANNSSTANTDANAVGMLLWNYDVSLINSTIVNNQANTHPGASGVGLYCSGTSVKVINTVIWGNTSSGTPVQVVGTPTYTNSLVAGVNLSGTPGFISPAFTKGASSTAQDIWMADWSPKFGSQLVDAGSNAGYGAGLQTDSDLAGKSRLVNTAVDIGAYEGFRTKPSVRDVILVMGQSNAEGSAAGTDVGGVQSWYDTHNPDDFKIYFKQMARNNPPNGRDKVSWASQYTVDNGAWTQLWYNGDYNAAPTPVKTSMGNGNFGIESALGRRWQEAFLKPLSIIKMGISSTAIEESGWDMKDQTGTTQSCWNFFTQFIYTPAMAKFAAAHNGETPRIRAIFWMQGEEDCSGGMNAQSYLEYLEAFRDKVRALPQMSADAKLILGTISTRSGYYSNEIRKAQVALAEKYDDVVLVNNDEASFGSDFVHFDKAAFWRMAGEVVNAVDSGVFASTRQYVKAGAGGDGSSWSNARGDIVSAVAALPSGGEIWVSGNFTLPAEITLTKEIKLYGGFTGTEKSLNERPLDLQGRPKYSVLTAASAKRHFTFGGAHAKLDGFLLAGGRASSAGGSVLMNAGFGIIYNCFFANNESAGTGGAVMVASSSNIVQNCYFVNNKGVGNGGGLATGPSASLNIVANCLYAFNECTSYGGASSEGTRYITFNSTAVYNKSVDGGGGFAISGGNYNADFGYSRNNLNWGNIPTSFNGLAKDANAAEGLTTVKINLNSSNTDPAGPQFVNPNPLNWSAGYNASRSLTDCLSLDYRLLSGSPCIGSGNIKSIPYTDLSGVVRSQSVSIGAFESAPGKVGRVTALRSGFTSGNVYTLTGADFTVAPANYYTISKITPAVIGPAAGVYTVSVECTPTEEGVTAGYAAFEGSAAIDIRSVLYVTEQGAGNKDGSSWTNAYAGTQLQTAIDAQVSGRDIWVAAGTYTAPDRAAHGNHDYGLRVSKPMKLYGGFAGNEISFEERDIKKNKTIIQRNSDTSGDLRVIIVFGNGISQADPVIIDGLILDGRNISSGVNGAVFGAYNSYATLRNCVIRNGVTTTVGGGIYIGAANCRIENCTVTRNTAAVSGGGIHLVEAADIINSQITYNTLTGRGEGAGGGGIYIVDGKAARITNSLVANNGALSGGENYPWGAGICAAGTSARPVVTNCTIVNNRTAGQSARTAVQCLTLYNCILLGNGTAGGAVDMQGYDCNGSNNYYSNFNTYNGTNRITGSYTLNDVFVRPSAISGPGDTTENPVWTLRKNSACIHAGDAAKASASDILGVNWQNGTPELGAYAFYNYAADSLTVSPEGRLYLSQTGTGDGSSWEKAAGASAFETALVKTGVNELWLAGGNYEIGTRITADANFVPALVYGGFAGFETALSERVRTGKAWEFSTVSRILGPVSGDAQMADRSGKTFDGITFEGRSARANGGGMFELGAGINTFRNCRFVNGGVSGSPANGGGALFSYAAGGFIVENCLFDKNLSNVGGGAIDHAGSGALAVRGSLFTGNSSGGRGGAIRLRGGNSTVENSVIANNKTTADDSAGIRVQSAAVLTNCLIANNECLAPGGYNAGIGNDNTGSLTAVNCTFANNKVLTASGATNSPGVSVFSWTNATLKNCAFIGGTSTAAVGAREVCAWGGTTTLDNCAMVSPASYGTANSGSVSANHSKFITAASFVKPGTVSGLDVNWASADYRPSALSAMIDSGVSAGAPTVDLNGLARPQYNAAAGYDIGAYEYDYPVVSSFKNTGTPSTDGDEPVQLHITLAKPNTTGAAVYASLTYATTAADSSVDYLDNRPDSIVIPAGSSSADVTIRVLPTSAANAGTLTIAANLTARSVYAENPVPATIEIRGNPNVPPVENGYYLITSDSHMSWFAGLSNSAASGVKAKIAADFELQTLTNFPIGSVSKPFSGELLAKTRADGSRYTVTVGNAAYSHFFGAVASSGKVGHFNFTFKNGLVLGPQTNKTFFATHFAGRLENFHTEVNINLNQNHYTLVDNLSGTLDQVSMRIQPGCTLSGEFAVGSLAGDVTGNSTLNRCSVLVEGTVAGTDPLYSCSGGLIGCLNADAALTLTGNIVRVVSGGILQSANAPYQGGLIGRLNGGTLSASCANNFYVFDSATATAPQGTAGNTEIFDGSYVIGENRTLEVLPMSAFTVIRKASTTSFNGLALVPSTGNDSSGDPWNQADVLSSFRTGNLAGMVQMIDPARTQPFPVVRLSVNASGAVGASDMPLLGNPVTFAVNVDRSLTVDPSGRIEITSSGDWDRVRMLVDKGNTLNGVTLLLPAALALGDGALPVGTADSAFEGHLRGRINADSTPASSVTLGDFGSAATLWSGLIGYAGTGAVIENVKVVLPAGKTVSGQNTAALAAASAGVIRNCEVDAAGTLTAAGTPSHAGALAAQTLGGTIEKVKVTLRSGAVLNAVTSAGGMIGSLNNSILKNSVAVAENNVSVTAASQGLFVGSNNAGNYSGNYLALFRSGNYPGANNAGQGAPGVLSYGKISGFVNTPIELGVPVLTSAFGTVSSIQPLWAFNANNCLVLNTLGESEGDILFTGTAQPRFSLPYHILVHLEGGTVRYVTASGGNDFQDGLSWESAYAGAPGIVTALNEASVTEVRLSNETFNVSGGITVPAGKKLIGGYDRNAGNLTANRSRLVAGGRNFPLLSLASGTSGHETTVENISAEDAKIAFAINHHTRLNGSRAYNNYSSDVETNNQISGSAIQVDGGTNAVVSRCILENNKDNNDQRGYVNGDGGTFVNCLMFNNINKSTGGAFHRTGTREYINCTFVGNTYAVNGFGGTNNAKNCIFFNNLNNNKGSVNYTHCASDRGESGMMITLNTNNTDPEGPNFINTADSFALQGYSKLVNRGNNDLISDMRDLAGNKRLQNYRVDLGAYESDSWGVTSNSILLTVSGGTVKKPDPVPSLYSTGDTIRVLADEPADGKAFTGWTVTAGEAVCLGTPAEAEAEFVILGTQNVTLTANYRNYAVRYVTAAGSNSKDGSSWENAGDSSQIQTFLDSVDEVRLAGSAAGEVYSLYTGFADASSVFKVPAGKVLSGGWNVAGNRYDPSLLSILKRLTTDNRRVVLLESGIAAAVTTVKGVRITNGNGLPGGGIYANANALVSDCEVCGNNADGNINAGGIQIAGNNVTVQNSYVHDNANSTWGAGIVAKNVSGVLIANTVITNHPWTQWGQSGIGNDGSAVTILNCVVAYNGNGGIGHQNGNGNTVINSIVYGNATYNLGGNYTLKNCYSDDPLFVAPFTTHDFNRVGGRNGWGVQATSACINTGDNASVSNLKTDIAGNERLWRPALATQAGLADIGAYEYSGKGNASFTFAAGRTYSGSPIILKNLVTTSPVANIKVVCSPETLTHAGTYPVAVTAADEQWTGVSNANFIVYPKNLPVAQIFLSVDKTQSPVKLTVEADTEGLGIRGPVSSYTASYFKNVGGIETPVTLAPNVDDYGTYRVAVVLNGNYNGSASLSFSISNPVQNIELVMPSNAVYDNTVKVVQVRNIDDGQIVDASKYTISYLNSVSGETTPRNAGTYSVNVELPGGPSAQGELTVQRAAATDANTVVERSRQIADGTVKAVMFSRTDGFPVAVSDYTVVYRLDGVLTTPVQAGIYAVTATFAGGNYTGTVTGTLELISTNIRYMTVSGAGYKDGLNWANAASAADLPTFLSAGSSVREVRAAGGEYNLASTLVPGTNKVVSGSWNTLTDTRIQPNVSKPWIFTDSTIFNRPSGSNRHLTVSAVDSVVFDGIWFKGTGIESGYASSTGGAVSVGTSNGSALRSCIISDNWIWDGGSGGGGLYFNGGSLEVSGCQIARNRSKAGGGAGVLSVSGTLTVRHSEISGNVMNEQGGSNGAGLAVNGGTVQVSNTLFHSNSTTQGNAAGVYTGGGNVTLTACTFANNTASGEGAVIFAADGSTLSVNSSLFANNETSNTWGGVGRGSGTSSTRYVNCTFVNNKAGGSEQFSGSGATIDNSILWVSGNSSAGKNGTTVYHACAVSTNPAPEGSFRVDEADGGTYFANANTVVGANPAWNASDWRLIDHTVLVNRGDNSLLNGISTDLAGNARIYDAAQGGVVDIGAYESAFKLEPSYTFSPWSATIVQGQMVSWDSSVLTVEPASVQDMLRRNAAVLYGGVSDPATLEPGLYDVKVTIRASDTAYGTEYVYADALIVTSSTRYVTLHGAGNRSGSDWANAADSHNLQTILQSAGVRDVRLAGSTLGDTYFPQTNTLNAAYEITVPSLTMSGSWDASTGTQNPSLKTILTRASATETRILDISASDARISNLSVVGGKTSVPGGGIHVSATGFELRHAVVSDNMTTHVNGGGGGLYVDNAFAVIENCVIAGNQSGDLTNNNQWGGGIALSANVTGGQMVNTLIANNRAGQGGGMICISRSTAVTLTNSTIVNNFSSSHNSAAISCSADNPENRQFRNILLWGNRNESSVSNISGGHTLVSSGVEMETRSGVIVRLASLNTDPAGPNFVNPTLSATLSASNWSLESFLAGTDSFLVTGASWLVNRADSAYLTGISTDLAGNARIQRAVPDIGAYESPLPGRASLVSTSPDLIYNGHRQVPVVSFDTTAAPAPESGSYLFANVLTSGDSVNVGDAVFTVSDARNNWSFVPSDVTLKITPAAIDVITFNNDSGVKFTEMDNYEFFVTVASAETEAPVLDSAAFDIQYQDLDGNPIAKPAVLGQYQTAALLKGILPASNYVIKTAIPAVNKIAFEIKSGQPAPLPGKVTLALQTISYNRQAQMPVVTSVIVEGSEYNYRPNCTFRYAPSGTLNWGTTVRNPGLYDVQVNFDGSSVPEGEIAYYGVTVKPAVLTVTIPPLYVQTAPSVSDLDVEEALSNAVISGGTVAFMSGSAPVTVNGTWTWLNGSDTFVSAGIYTEPARFISADTYFASIEASLRVLVNAPDAGIRYVTIEGGQDVDSSGRPSRNGRSWQTAADSTLLQSMLNQPGIREVRVGAGKYVSTTVTDGPSTGLGNSAVGFTLPAGVKLLGGYPQAGGSEADPKVNLTSLTIPAGFQNCRVVYMTAGTSSDSTVIDGFTLSGGRTRSSGVSFTDIGSAGAGLYVNAGGLASRCVMTDNIADVGGFDVTLSAYSAGGAGVMMRGGNLFDCTVSNNRINNATAAGAAAMNSAVIDSCMIENNELYNGSTRYAGGVYLVGSVLKNSIILNNTVTGTTSGAGVCMRFLPSSVENCRISGNSGASNGGGIYSEISGSGVKGCEVVSNTCSQNGGGVYLGAGNTVIQNSVIAANTCANFGGGVALAPGAGGSSTPMAVNCVIVNNHSGNHGGGLTFVNNSSFSAVNCTIANNTAANQGGGVWVGASNRLYNSAVWGNTAGTSPEIYGVNASNTSNSAIQGETAGTNTLTLNGVSEFVKASAGAGPANYDSSADWSLQDTALMINRANAAYLAGITTDINGDSRIQRGVPDIGAYESSLPGRLPVFFTGTDPVIYNGSAHVAPAASAVNPPPSDPASYSLAYTAFDSNGTPVALDEMIHAGTYTIRVSDAFNNWVMTPDSVRFEILPQSAVFALADGVKTFNGQLQTASVSNANAPAISGFTVAYGGLSGAVNAGIYPVTVRFADTDYAPAAADSFIGNFEILPMNVTFSVMSHSLTYDGTPKRVTVQPSSGLVTDTAYRVAYGNDYADSKVDAGSYPVWVFVTDTNFKTATNPFNAGTMTIGKALPVLTVEALGTPAWDDAPFARTVTLTEGLTFSASSSNSSVAAVSAREAQSDILLTPRAVGASVISLSTSGNANYMARTIEETLVVKRANPKIRPDTDYIQIKLGESTSFSVASASGLPFASVSVDTAVVRMTSDTTLYGAGVGQTQIAVSQNGDTLYEPDTVYIAVTVADNPGYIVILDTEKVYNAFAQPATISAGSSVRYSVEYRSSSGQTFGNQGPVNADTYVLTVTDLSSHVKFVSSFIIAKAPLSVSAEPQTKLYRSPDPVLSYRIVSGRLFGSDHFTGALVRQSGESVGVYPISAGTLTAGPNYKMTFTGSTLTIEQVVIVFNILNNEMLYTGFMPEPVIATSPYKLVANIDYRVDSSVNGLTRNVFVTLLDSGYKFEAWVNPVVNNRALIGSQNFYRETPPEYQDKISVHILTPADIIFEGNTVGLNAGADVAITALDVPGETFVVWRVQGGSVLEPNAAHTFFRAGTAASRRMVRLATGFDAVLSAVYRLDAAVMLSASRDFEDVVKVTWKAAPDQKDVWFRLMREDLNAGGAPEAVTGWTQDTSFTDHDVLPGHRYRYNVTVAADEEGTEKVNAQSNTLVGWTTAQVQLIDDVFFGARVDTLRADLVLDPALADTEHLFFDRKPSIYGKAVLPGKSRESKLPMRVLTKPVNKNNPRLLVAAEWTKKITLYDKAFYRAWMKDAANNGTAGFVKNSLNQPDSLMIPLWCKTVFSKKRVNAPMAQTVYYMAPSISSTSMDSALGSDTVVNLREGSVVGIYGKAFGRKLPAVWLESRSEGKIKKLKLKVERILTYPDASGKPNKSCTDPVSGESVIWVIVPERAWPKGFVPGDVWTLVLDNGSGFAVRKAYSEY